MELLRRWISGAVGLGTRSLRKALQVNPGVLAGIGLAAYLLTIPFGAFGGWWREAPLAVMLLGVILGRLKGRDVELVDVVIVFGASSLVSIWLSETPAKSLELAIYLPIAFMFFFATQDAVTDLAGYRLLFAILAAVCLISGLDGTYQAITGHSMLRGNPVFLGPETRVSASFPNPNDLALLPITLPFVVALVLLGRLSAAGIVLLIGIPMVVLTAILSGSRNIWAGLLACLATFVVLSRGGRVVWSLCLIVAILSGVSLSVGLGSVRARAAMFVDMTRDYRIGQWIVALKMFQEAPVFGKGLHSFGDLYARYSDDVELATGYAAERRRIPWPHNLYFEILAERGIVGALAASWVLARCARRVIQSLRQGGPPRVIGVALAAAFAAFLTEALFELTFLKDWVLILFWILVALAARLPTIIWPDHADRSSAVG